MNFLSLSPKNRTTALLFYFEQLTLYEISALLGSSVTAIKGRLHKARKQLQEKLLPLYIEDSSVVVTNQKTKPMMQVTVADLVFSPKHAPDSCMAILWDEVNRRLLPIYIGIPTGEAIAQILTETSLPRPMVFQFMSNMLKAANVSLESVRVESLQDNTFYAIVSLSCGDRIQEVDARPSDAIALALLMNSPIYVNEAVMNEASVEAPLDVEGAPTGRGLTRFRSEQEKKQQEQEQKQERELQEMVNKAQQQSREGKVKSMKFLFERD
jgi:uncharacterized protein